jgi:hypothetical protein
VNGYYSATQVFLRELSMSQVDPESRILLANAIEQYLDGKIDSFALDDTIFDLPDRDQACVEIGREMSRFLGDFKKQMYDSAQLLPQYEEGLRRWILLLRSAVEWPPDATSARGVQKLLNFFRLVQRTEFGRNPFWPYETQADWDSKVGRNAQQ